MKSLVSSKRRLLGMIVALLCSTAMWAATVLQLNEPFTVKNFDFNCVWTYTATEGGIVKIAGATNDASFGSCLDIYDDEACTNYVEANFTYSPVAHYEFSVVAGKTYYIKNNNWSGQDYNAMLTMGEAFAFTSCTPEDGGKFYITSNSEAHLCFTSSSVSFTEGELAANGNVVKIYNFTDYNELVSSGIFTYSQEGTNGVVNWNGNICARTENEDGIVISFTSSTGRDYFNVVNRWYEQGKLNANDEMKLTIHGVKNSVTGELLGGDGEIELTWYFAGAPTTLVSAAMPAVVYSWFNEGDPNGVATYTFSRSIKSARATLVMGQGEGADDLYSEEIADDHIRINGNVVTVDLCGVMRTKKTMDLKMNWSSFSLKLLQVVDENGNDAYSEGLGSASSYEYSIPYKDISATLSSEIIPATGSTLSASNKEVEIWFNNPELIEYDGISIDYILQGEAHSVFVPKAELDITTDVDGTTIICPLPEGIHEANSVCVRLNITKTADGLPHDIVAYYNNSVVYALDLLRYASPENETTVHRLSEIYLTLGTTYAINNKLKTPVTVTSKTNKQFSCGGTIVTDGMTNAKIVLDEAITEAGSYTVTIAQGAIGDYIYGESEFKGGTASIATVLNYTVSGMWDGRDVVAAPDNGETVSVLKEISLTFLNYNSVAPSWNAEKEAYIEEIVEGAEPIKHEGSFVQKDSYDNQLVFALNQPITKAGQYRFVLTAGSVVNGATGTPLTETYEFSYTIDEAAPMARPVVNPEEGEYDELNTITIDFGQPVTWDDSPWAFIMVPEIIDENGDGYPGEIMKGENEGEVVFYTYDPIVKAGTYTLKVYAEAFTDADGNALGEQVYTYTYTITGVNDIPDTPIEVPAEFGAVQTDPADGATVANIETISLSFEHNWAMVGCIDGKYIELLDADDNVVATAWNGVETDWDWETFEVKGYTINFEEPITTSGNYKLVMPLSVMAADWVTVYEETIVVNLTIDSADNINAVKAQNGEAYTISGVKANANKPGLYIVNGKKIVVSK